VAVAASVLLAGACATGEGERPRAAGSTSASSAPCAPGTAGPKCGPVWPPATAQQVRDRLPTRDDLDSDRYRRSEEVEKKFAGSLPGCDLTRVPTGVPMASWRHYSEWRHWPDRRTARPSDRRYTYTMQVALYPSAAAAEAAFRKLRDSRCRGGAEHYTRRTGQMGGWTWAQRAQRAYCVRGGTVCTYVMDYARRDHVLAVAVLGEGANPANSARGPLTARADRFREVLARRLAGDGAR
jgi:hypothetical protein